jgi:hypothetical protein
LKIHERNIMSISDKANENVQEPADSQGTDLNVAASGVPETALPISGRPQPDPAASSMNEYVTESDPSETGSVMRSGERAPGSPVPEHIERAIDNAAGKAASEVAAYAREIGSQVPAPTTTEPGTGPATSANRLPDTGMGTQTEAAGQDSKWATSEDPGDKIFVRDTAGDVEDTADLRDATRRKQRGPEDVMPDVRDRATPRIN